MPDEDWRLLVRIAWYTGLRRGELHALSWEESPRVCWIDLQNRRIVIPAEGCKADADSWLPIHDDLLPVLEAIPASARKGRVLRVAKHVCGVSRILTRLT